jgi:hypothetical protein
VHESSLLPCGRSSLCVKLFFLYFLSHFNHSDLVIKALAFLDIREVFLIIRNRESEIDAAPLQSLFADI